MIILKMVKGHQLFLLKLRTPSIMIIRASGSHLRYLVGRNLLLKKQDIIGLYPLNE